MAADVFFPLDELKGWGLGDAMVKSGGTLNATRKDAINHTVKNLLHDTSKDPVLEDTVNKFAMKNELSATLKFAYERGRKKFSIDIKQTKGGEVNLGVFLAKIEKSKELLKISFGQEDKKYLMTDTVADRPGATEKGKPVYLKDDKITKVATGAEKAGVLVSFDAKTATVRSWEWGGHVLGIGS